jgi:hypothetical protein
LFLTISYDNNEYFKCNQFSFELTLPCSAYTKNTFKLLEICLSYTKPAKPKTLLPKLKPSPCFITSRRVDGVALGACFSIGRDVFMV